MPHVHILLEGAVLHVTILLSSFDASADLGRLYAEIVEQDFGTCLIDLARVDTMDSAAIAFLLRLAAGFDDKKHGLGIVGACDHVANMLKLTALGQYLKQSMPASPKSACIHRCSERTAK